MTEKKISPDADHPHGASIMTVVGDYLRELKITRDRAAAAEKARDAAHDELIIALSQLEELRKDYETAVRDLAGFKDRELQAAELLRSVVGDLLDERAIDWTEWQLSAQQWLRDAEGK